MKKALSVIWVVIFILALLACIAGLIYYHYTGREVVSERLYMDGDIAVQVEKVRLGKDAVIFSLTEGFCSKGEKNMIVITIEDDTNYLACNAEKELREPYQWVKDDRLAIAKFGLVNEEVYGEELIHWGS